MATRPAITRSTTAPAERHSPGRGPIALGNGLDAVFAHVQLEHPDLPRAWFLRLRVDAVAGGMLHIFAENADQLRYLETRCVAAFNEAAQAVTGRLVTVVFECTQALESQPADGHSQAWKSDEGRTFESFVVGPGNAFAHAAALAVVQAPGRSYNPLFLHGRAGVGKTHLLHAITRGLDPRGGSAGYWSASSWTNDLMTSLERDDAHDFRRRYRSVGALVVDDVDDLNGCDYSQEELFAAVNSLLIAGRQVVVSAACSPVALQGIAERLSSRFASGLVAPLDPPTPETRIAILRRQASLRFIEVSDEVVRFLAASVGGSCHELISALIRTDSLARLAGSPPTVEFAEQAVAGP